MEFISQLCNLQNKSIVLASQSPRRIELLRSTGLKFEIYPPKIEEKIRDEMFPADYVRHNASEKAHWVAEKVKFDLIISADTVVTVNSKIFGKPSDPVHAKEMLKELSNREHTVFTGFCLLTNKQLIIDYEETRVRFYPLREAEIDMYLLTEEPFDKAGAYAIQGFASLFIKNIMGCYFNVVGFPLGKFYQNLKKLNI
jgi:septum formation protein